jgi:hypothetical protein
MVLMISDGVTYYSISMRYQRIQILKTSLGRLCTLQKSTLLFPLAWIRICVASRPDVKLGTRGTAPTASATRVTHGWTRRREVRATARRVGSRRCSNSSRATACTWSTELADQRPKQTVGKARSFTFVQNPVQCHVKDALRHMRACLPDFLHEPCALPCPRGIRVSSSWKTEGCLVLRPKKEVSTDEHRCWLGNF